MQTHRCPGFQNAPIQQSCGFHSMRTLTRPLLRY